MRRILASLPALALLAAPIMLHAQGGPPMITDDPGTPGPGNWEINIAALTSRFASGTEWESPLLDLNYGVGERIQLKYEVAWVTQTLRTHPARSGLGNSLLGVKWRFYDTGADHWMVSTYPQLMLRNPASHSSQRGLAREGTDLLLPIELQRTFSLTDVNIEVGRELPSRGAGSWFGGAVLGRQISQRLQLLSELRGECVSSRHGSAVAINLGTRIGFPGRGTLLISVGRDLRNSWQERSLVFGYLGWQITTDERRAGD